MRHATVERDRMMNLAARPPSRRRLPGDRGWLSVVLVAPDPRTLAEMVRDHAEECRRGEIEILADDHAGGWS